MRKMKRKCSKCGGNIGSLEAFQIIGTETRCTSCFEPPANDIEMEQSGSITEMTNAILDLLEVGQEVVDCWTKGSLADAVNKLRATIEQYDHFRDSLEEERS